MTFNQWYNFNKRFIDSDEYIKLFLQNDENNVILISTVKICDVAKLFGLHDIIYFGPLKMHHLLENDPVIKLVLSDTPNYTCDCH